MHASRLTQLQRDVLQRFFATEQRFFLTGGAALVGFHLGHRDTDDLDLFTSTQAAVLEEGRRALGRVAQELGGSVTTMGDSREHKRLLLRRGSEELKIDLASELREQDSASPEVVAESSPGPSVERNIIVAKD